MTILILLLINVCILAKVVQQQFLDIIHYVILLIASRLLHFCTDYVSNVCVYVCMCVVFACVFANVSVSC